MSTVLLKVRILLIRTKIWIGINRVLVILGLVALGGGVGGGYLLSVSLSQPGFLQPTAQQRNPSEAATASASPQDYFSQMLKETTKPAPTSATLPTSPTNEETPTTAEPKPTGSGETPFNILLLGSDRRSPSEGWGRMDAIMILSLQSQSKRIILTSFPRDLYLGGQRINAVHSSRGISGLKQEMTRITGLNIDRYLLTDFDGVAWAVDLLGGLDVNIDRTFTDTQYPGHRQGQEGNITVSFTAGPQHLSGEEVVIYCRSRKGDNSEGSDFARATRQRKVILALPSNLMRALGSAGTDKINSLYSEGRGRAETDLTSSDLLALYAVAQDFGSYQISQIDISSYLYNPPLADYGGAWVLVPQTGNFNQIQQVILNQL